MIPKNIERKHIIKALEEIDETGWPKRRASTKYSVKYENSFYPPKYVLSVANRYANGTELDPETFQGGDPANHFLKSRGFKIIDKGTKDII